jgi:hypothetical protein
MLVFNRLYHKSIYILNFRYCEESAQIYVGKMKLERELKEAKLYIINY